MESQVFYNRIRLIIARLSLKGNINLANALAKRVLSGKSTELTLFLENLEMFLLFTLKLEKEIEKESKFRVTKLHRLHWLYESRNSDLIRKLNEDNESDCNFGYHCSLRAYVNYFSNLTPLEQYFVLISNCILMCRIFSDKKKDELLNKNVYFLAGKEKVEEFFGFKLDFEIKNEFKNC